MRPAHRAPPKPCRQSAYGTAPIRSGSLPPDRLLLVWGAEDKAVPLSVAHECRAALGGPELAIIPAANHCPYLEQPAAFDVALVPFLKHAFGGRS